MPALGIDYGQRRIGLAVSDGLDMLAHGLPTIDRRETEDPVAAIAAICDEHHVEELVLGLPKRMDGSLGSAAEEVQAFAEQLRDRVGLPVALFDERLTTVQAHGRMKRAGMKRKRRAQAADRVAAQILLQSYLDRKKRGTL